MPAVALRLGRPVKWVEGRREHFVATGHDREQVHRARIALPAGRDDRGRRRRVPGRRRRVSHRRDRAHAQHREPPAGALPGAQLPERRHELRDEQDAERRLPRRGAPGGRRSSWSASSTSGRGGSDSTPSRSAGAIWCSPARCRTGRASPTRTGSRSPTTRATSPPASSARSSSSATRSSAPARPPSAGRRRRIGLGVACYVQGSGIGPVRGRAGAGRPERPGLRDHRGRRAGPGPPDHPRPDLRGGARRAPGRRPHRGGRHAALPHRHGHGRQPRRGEHRPGGRPHRARGPRAGAAGRRRAPRVRAGGRPHRGRPGVRDAGFRGARSRSAGSPTPPFAPRPSARPGSPASSDAATSTRTP